MTSDLQSLHAYMTSLIRRERWLLSVRVALQLGLLGCVVLIYAVLAAWNGWDRATAAATIVGLAGIGAWLVGVVPVVVGWRRAADLSRQAVMVEQLEPTLRGRLITTVSRLEGPEGRESDALLALIASGARDVVENIPVSKVHSAQSAGVLAVGMFLASLLTLPTVFLAPGGVTGVAGWWFRGTPMAELTDGHDVTSAADVARVGDVVLRYTYPAYTGLDPYEVVNSTGEVRAPPGTLVEVVAKSGEAVEAAALVAYGDTALDAYVSDGRSVKAQFTVQADPGSWHLVLYRNGVAESSADFPITPEPDLAPEVVVAVNPPVEPIEVSVNDRIPIEWVARDDYGIQRVVLEVNQKEHAPALSKPRVTRIEVTDWLGLTPRDIGLQSGEDAELVIAAWDNDTFSGSKVGRSRPVKVMVLGPRGNDRLSLERQEALLDLLVDVLADHLEEPFPPGTTAGGYALWGETLGARYAPFDEFIEEHWQGFFRDSVESGVVREVMSEARRLIRYTQVTFLPGSRDEVLPSIQQSVAEMQTDTIASLENGILRLDALLQSRAYQDLAKEAEQLAMEADRLQAELDAEEVSPMALQVELDGINDELERVQETAERLRQGGMRDFVETRSRESTMLSEEVRNSLSKEEKAQAEELAQRLSTQLDEMAQGIQENLDRMMEEAASQQNQAADLKEELEEIAKKQDALQTEVQSIREKYDEVVSEDMNNLWTEVDKLAVEIGERVDAYQQGLEATQRSFNERTRVRGAEEVVLEVLDAVSARDLYGTRASADDLDNEWRIVHRGFLAIHWDEANRPSNPGLLEIGQVDQRIGALHDLLDQLEQRDQAVDPMVREQVRQHHQAQRQLAQRLETARQQAEQVVAEMSVTPEDLEEHLENAGERMDQAGDHIRLGQPMQAEGSQGAASEHVRDAIRALEDAMQQQAQQQQEMSGSSAGSEGEEDDKPSPEDDGEDGEDTKARSIDLPEPEEFRTPEEYRRALLEGMEGGVPEEYRVLKKRYYEELVHQ